MIVWKDGENFLAGTHKSKNPKDSFEDDPYGGEAKKYYKTTSTIRGEKWSAIFGESEALMNKPVDLLSDVSMWMMRKMKSSCRTEHCGESIVSPLLDIHCTDFFFALIVTIWTIYW